MHGAADGDTGTGQGAIVYNRPASAANFTLVQSCPRASSRCTRRGTCLPEARRASASRSCRTSRPRRDLDGAGRRQDDHDTVSAKAGSRDEGSSGRASSPTSGARPEGREALPEEGVLLTGQGPQRRVVDRDEGARRSRRRRKHGKRGEARHEGHARREHGLAARALKPTRRKSRIRCYGTGTLPGCGNARRAVRAARTTPRSPVSASRAELRSRRRRRTREERRIVSVVFVDLVGFTSRSEQLDPEDVRAILTPYHGTVRDELESFGGVVEKFVGDAVMAVFGAPTAHGDDPERAVRAALAVRDAVTALNAEQPELELRIRGAVNTGEAVVTLSARPALGEAMVAGDVVNTASRLQQHAPVGEIVVGEETYRATRSAIEYEPVEAVTAKGKAAPIAAWRAVAAASATRRAPPVEHAVRRPRPGGRPPRCDLGARRARAPPAPHHRPRPAGVGKSRLDGGVHGAHLGARRSRRPRPLPAVSRAQRVRRVRDAGEGSRRHLRQRRRRRCATDKLRALVERLVGPERGRVVAGHLAILLGFETQATTPDRDSLFQSVRVFIEAVARDEATAFVFEDIHWADPALLDLIELLADTPPRPAGPASDARPAGAARRATRLGRRPARLQRAPPRAARTGRTRRSSRSTCSARTRRRPRWRRRRRATRSSSSSSRPC